MVFDFFEDLSSENNDRSSTISNFRVLGPSDISEDASGGMDNVEELYGIKSAEWV